MASKYAFFDVETPNNRHNNICSIGLIVCDAQRNTISQSYTLVNPEQDFHTANMQIHHINPTMVRQAPKFGDVWSHMIQPAFDDAIVVGHNVKFDLAVLWKACQSHHIAFGSYPCVDTMVMARKLMPDNGSYKLDNLDRQFGNFGSNHHNALADTEMCKNVFYELIDRYRCGIRPFVSTYLCPLSQTLNVAQSSQRQTSFEF